MVQHTHMWPLVGVALAHSRRLSEVGDAVHIPFWLIILAVVAVCVLIIGGCACFAVRCFTPENHLGPLIEVNSAGKRWVRRPNTVDRWLAYERQTDPEKPLEGGAPGTRLFGRPPPQPQPAVAVVPAAAVPAVPAAKPKVTRVVDGQAIV